jgi:hypothetical protein
VNKNNFEGQLNCSSNVLLSHVGLPDMSVSFEVGEEAGNKQRSLPIVWVIRKVSQLL